LIFDWILVLKFVWDLQPSEMFKDVCGKAGPSFSRNEWASLLANDASKKRLLSYAACVLPQNRVPVDPFEQVQSLIAFHANGKVTVKRLLQEPVSKVVQWLNNAVRYLILFSWLRKNSMRILN
jgi:hypothetical protein